MEPADLFRLFFVGAALGFAVLWGYNLASVGYTRDKLYTPEEGLLVAVPRFVLLSASLAGMVLYGARPSLMAWSSIPVPHALRWCGLIVSGAALGLFAWVLRVLGPNFSTSLTLRHDQTLVLEGPYRWVRHPMYVAFLGLWFGYFLLTANGFIGITGIGAIVWVIALRTRKEEQLMIRRFGSEYLEYMERSGRYLPRLGAHSRPRRRAADAPGAEASRHRAAP